MIATLLASSVPVVIFVAESVDIFASVIAALPIIALTIEPFLM